MCPFERAKIASLSANVDRSSSVSRTTHGSDGKERCWVISSPVVLRDQILRCSRHARATPRPVRRGLRRRRRRNLPPARLPRRRAHPRRPQLLQASRRAPARQPRRCRVLASLAAPRARPPPRRCEPRRILQCPRRPAHRGCWRSRRLRRGAGPPRAPPQGSAPSRRRLPHPLRGSTVRRVRSCGCPTRERSQRSAGRQTRPQAARCPVRRETTAPRRSAACHLRTECSQQPDRKGRTPPLFAPPARASTRRTSPPKRRHGLWPSGLAPHPSRTGMPAHYPASRSKRPPILSREVSLPHAPRLPLLLRELLGPS